MRRVIGNKAELEKILNMTNLRNKYVVPYIQDFLSNDNKSDSNNQYAAQFLAVLGEQPVIARSQQRGSVPDVSDVIMRDMDEIIAVMPQCSMDVYVNAYKAIAQMFGVALQPIDNITGLAMTIQNACGSSNEHRRVQISSGKYRDVFDSAVARQIIYEYVCEWVTNQIRAEINAIVLARNAQLSSNDAVTFGLSRDLNTAAGVLLSGVMVGTNLRYFVQVLQKGGCPLAFEKLKMLITGQYRGIQLIRDANKCPYGRWVPSYLNEKRFTTGCNLTPEQQAELKFTGKDNRLQSHSQLEHKKKAPRRF